MAAINVDKMSLKELVALEAKVQGAIAEARTKERSDVKGKVAEFAASHLVLHRAGALRATERVLLSGIVVGESFVGIQHHGLGVHRAAVVPAALAVFMLEANVQSTHADTICSYSFAAQTGELPVVAWVLFVAGVMWTTAYDTIYAMVDREDDLVIGIRSSAILFGRADRGIVVALQAGTLILLAFAGYLAQLGRWYWLGLGLAVASSLYQQYLIRRRDPAACFRAFLNNNLFGLAVFAGILLDYLFAR